MARGPHWRNMLLWRIKFLLMNGVWRGIPAFARGRLRNLRGPEKHDQDIPLRPDAQNRDWLNPLFGHPTTQQCIQGFYDHTRDRVAVFLCIFLNTFEQPAGDVDYNLLGIIAACG
jgi:hypothetical protein